MDSLRAPIALAPWFAYAVAIAILVIAAIRFFGALRQSRRDFARHRARAVR